VVCRPEVIVSSPSFSELVIVCLRYLGLSEKYLSIDKPSQTLSILIRESNRITLGRRYLVQETEKSLIDPSAQLTDTIQSDERGACLSVSLR
jgi:hypothetical protein